MTSAVNKYINTLAIEDPAAAASIGFIIRADMIFMWTPSEHGDIVEETFENFLEHSDTLRASTGNARFCSDTNDSLIHFEQQIESFTSMELYEATIKEYINLVKVTISFSRPNFIQSGTDIIEEYIKASKKEHSCFLKAQVLSFIEMQSIRMRAYMQLFDIET